MCCIYVAGGNIGIYIYIYKYDNNTPLYSDGICGTGSLQYNIHIIFCCLRSTLMLYNNNVCLLFSTHIFIINNVISLADYLTAEWQYMSLVGVASAAAGRVQSSSSFDPLVLMLHWWRRENVKCLWREYCTMTDSPKLLQVGITLYKRRGDANTKHFGRWIHETRVKFLNFHLLFTRYNTYYR